jgi:hypothetical protein
MGLDVSGDRMTSVRTMPWASKVVALSCAITVVAAGCGGRFPPTPRVRDLLLGNLTGEDQRVHIVEGAGGGSIAWLTVPGRAKVVVQGMPVSCAGIFVIVVDANCSIITPEPFGGLPTNNSNPVTVAVITEEGDVGSTDESTLNGLTMASSSPAVPCPSG